MTEQQIGRYMIGIGCIMEHEPSGKILCLRRERANFLKGEWELMYGRIDQHEELFEALRREVWEEVGIKEFEIVRLLRLWHFYRGEKSTDTEIHGYTFHCLVADQEVTISTEHSEYKWVTPQEALELITVPGVKEDVRFFIENRNNRKIALSGISNKIDTEL